MKKNLFLLILFLSFTFISCNEENDDNTDSHKLIGTCWNLEKSSQGYEYQRICFFTGRGSFSSKLSSSSKDDISEINYTYNEPNITITYKDGSRFGSGYIEGNKLYIEDGNNAGTYIRN